ncbi:hypothetical protein KFK09_027974 [Dendrobium nobile]|uniref:Uncharacterized protein n=1 Tax=Dendrobium nobile TaxID=94219 RepID=A0A8T3A1W3_DENNO|nr:hypothetical protein KFK09_027974 [Dendrobium nobile]
MEKYHTRPIQTTTHHGYNHPLFPATYRHQRHHVLSPYSIQNYWYQRPSFTHVSCHYWHNEHGGHICISIATVDMLGRRNLFIEEVLIKYSYVRSLWAHRIKFGVTGVHTKLSKSYVGLVVAFICIYVSVFAWSWGLLDKLVPSEIFRLEIRSAG